MQLPSARISALAAAHFLQSRPHDRASHGSVHPGLLRLHRQQRTHLQGRRARAPGRQGSPAAPLDGGAAPVAHVTGDPHYDADCRRPPRLLRLRPARSPFLAWAKCVEAYETKLLDGARRKFPAHTFRGQPRPWGEVPASLKETKVKRPPKLTAQDFCMSVLTCL